MDVFWNLGVGLPVLRVSRVFPQFAPRKSFLEFSGNRSALILLLEYPGKTGCSGRQLKGAGPGPAFLFRASGEPTHCRLGAVARLSRGLNPIDYSSDVPEPSLDCRATARFEI